MWPVRIVGGRVGVGGWLLVLALAGGAGCAGPKAGGPVVDRDLYDLNSLARSAFDLGAEEEAARHYRRALDRARVVDQPVEVANAAYNLAVCLYRLGEFDEARQRLGEARAELKRIGKNAPDVWLMEAKVARHQGDLEDTLAVIEDGLASLGRDRDRLLRVRFLTLRADAAGEAGDAVAARQAYDEAIRLGGARTPPDVAAALASVSGQLHLLSEAYLLAAGEFDREAALRQAAGQYAEMALARVRAADAYALAGKPGDAARRYFLAARGLHAQGRQAGAPLLIEKALNHAELAQDEELAAQVRALSREINRAASPASKRVGSGKAADAPETEAKD